MPAVYFHKRQDTFPNVYCCVIWQSQFALDGCLAFMKINARTLFPTSTAMSLTVAVCSRWMPGVYENKCQDSFPNVYCYVPWKSQFVLDGCLFMKLKSRTFPNIYCNVPWESQFVLDGCLSFMKIDTRTLFPTSTAICLDNRSFVLDWCLPFIFINARTLFPTSTAMSFDSRSLFSMDAWRLWK